MKNKKPRLSNSNTPRGNLRLVQNPEPTKTPAEVSAEMQQKQQQQAQAIQTASPQGPMDSKQAHSAGRPASKGFVSVHSAALHSQPAEGGRAEIEEALSRMPAQESIQKAA